MFWRERPHRQWGDPPVDPALTADGREALRDTIIDLCSTLQDLPAVPFVRDLDSDAADHVLTATEALSEAVTMLEMLAGDHGIRV